MNESVAGALLKLEAVDMKTYDCKATAFAFGIIDSARAIGISSLNPKSCVAQN